MLLNFLLEILSTTDLDLEVARVGLKEIINQGIIAQVPQNRDLSTISLKVISNLQIRLEMEITNLGTLLRKQKFRKTYR